MKKSVLLVVALLVTSFSFSQDERLTKIDEFLSYLFENDKFMGSLVIRKGDSLIFKEAYGFYEANRGLRANGNTKYKIGSVTKTFTATMIMQLVEAKKLRLETRISRFFPKIAMASYISVNDLLQQRSGIMDYVNADETFKEKLITGESREDLLERIADYEAIFEPGTKHMYSNTNYYLLGCIIENITKKSYAENLKELIVDKIGLKNTYYTTEKTDVSKRESYSYLYNGSTWEQFPEWDNSVAFASGGIISTPDDLSLFISSLFSGKLVSPASLDQMKKIKDGYGMGLMQFPFGERRFFGHNGKIENFNAVVGYYPKEKLSIALISNADVYNQNDIMLGILSMYYKMPFPFPEFTKLDPDEIKPLLGVYNSDDLPLQIVIKEKNGELIAQATGQPPFPLTYFKDTTFVFQSAGVEITFGLDSFVLKQAGMKYKYTKN